MRVIHMASEFAPLAKVGGLGDVLLGLSREQKKLYSEAAVFLPFYDFIDKSSLSFLKQLDQFSVDKHLFTVFQAEFEGISLFLLEELSQENPLQRGEIYQGDRDVRRFIKFCLAGITFFKRQKKPVDILHLHDWHSALAALLSSSLDVQEVVLTLHNAGYQGQCRLADLESCGMKRDPFLAKGLISEKGEINLLQVGIEYADRVVAVSPTYAKEILTPEFSLGLAPFLRSKKKKLSGVLNGLDALTWNPASDSHLPLKYGKEMGFASIQKGKAAAKEALLQIFSKKQAQPWVGMISRLVKQKGPQFVELAIEETLKAHGSFYLLGSTPSPEFQPLFEKLQNEYSNHPHVHLHFHFDEKLAHLMYAALDFFWMPSLYEPCGLSQMISMLYGAVPIASKTGGMRDTVFDAEDAKVPFSKRNGFLFTPASADAARKKLQEALFLFRENKALYQKLVHNGMHSQFSWKPRAQEYDKLYRQKAKKKLSDIVA